MKRLLNYQYNLQVSQRKMWVIFHNPIVLFGSVAQWSSIRQSQPAHCSASFLFVFIFYLHELAFFVFDNEQLSSPFMRYTWITLYDFPFLSGWIKEVEKGRRRKKKKFFFPRCEEGLYKSNRHNGAQVEALEILVLHLSDISRELTNQIVGFHSHYPFFSIRSFLFFSSFLT